MSASNTPSKAQIQDESRSVLQHTDVVDVAGNTQGRAEQRLWDSERRSRAWLECSPVCTKIIDLDFNLQYMSSAGIEALGIDDITEYYGKPYPFGFFSSSFREQMTRDLEKVRDKGEIVSQEGLLADTSGNEHWFHATLAPVYDDEGRIDYIIVVSINITESKRAEENRRLAESQLFAARKLEALGRLAAGISHEINTPTQFIADNTRFLDKSFGELVPLLEKAGELADAVCSGASCRALADELKLAMNETEVAFLAGEIPRAIGESLEGIEKVGHIVQSMTEFSHPGGEEFTHGDINHAIENAVTLAASEWKYVADVETNLDPELPLVPCLMGGVNQVILNVLVNAAHAIADRLGNPPADKGTITMSTRLDGDWAEIRVSDTGSGIREEARSEIFDPFFTTKEVGKGTGQGLSIAHGIVVNQHGGTLTFETEVGVGTTFIIRLPLLMRTITGTT